LGKVILVISGPGRKMYQSLEPKPEGAIFLKRSKPQGASSSPHDTGASIANWLKSNIQGDESSAVGEVDVDVAEVGLEALAWEVAQRDEGLLVAWSLLEHVALHLGVATGVAMLVAEAAKDLCSGVPLLGRGVLVVGEDLVDGRLEAAELGREAVAGCGERLGMLEGFPDRDPGEVEFPGDLADGLAIAPRPPNGSVVVHRKHVLDPP
jgi:hypothetical protein